jgi:hypothetical protein
MHCSHLPAIRPSASDNVGNLHALAHVKDLKYVAAVVFGKAFLHRLPLTCLYWI